MFSFSPDLPEAAMDQVTSVVTVHGGVDPEEGRVLTQPHWDPVYGGLVMAVNAEGMPVLLAYSDGAPEMVFSAESTADAMIRNLIDFVPLGFESSEIREISLAALDTPEGHVLLDEVKRSLAEGNLPGERAEVFVDIDDVLLQIIAERVSGMDRDP